MDRTRPARRTPGPPAGGRRARPRRHRRLIRVPDAGGHRGPAEHVYVETTVFPSNNANHALATGTVAAVLRYPDRQAVLAAA